MAELTAVVGEQIRPDMVTAAVMPESYLAMMVTADRAVAPLNIDSSGFVIDANKNFVIDSSGNKLWNMYEPGTLDATNPYIIAQDSSGVLSAFPNFLATQGGYIIPSESSSPVALNNLANNIQDMQLPPLSAAQNPNVNQGIAATPKNNNMLYIGAGVVLLLLLRK